MSDVAGIAVPLITGIGGLLIGAGFSRVTSRNDQRRQVRRRALRARQADRQHRRHRFREGLRRVVEFENWLKLDSVPVSNAFKTLRETPADSSAESRAAVAEARRDFIEAARKYSTWRLSQRFWLQARTKPVA